MSKTNKVQTLRSAIEKEGEEMNRKFAEWLNEKGFASQKSFIRMFPSKTRTQNIGMFHAVFMWEKQRDRLPIVALISKDFLSSLDRQIREYKRCLNAMADNFILVLKKIKESGDIALQENEEEELDEISLGEQFLKSLHAFNKAEKEIMKFMFEVHVLLFSPCLRGKLKQGSK